MAYLLQTSLLLPHGEQYGVADAFQNHKLEEGVVMGMDW
jgi:hypothetical protein